MPAFSVRAPLGSPAPRGPRGRSVGLVWLAAVLAPLSVAACSGGSSSTSGGAPAGGQPAGGSSAGGAEAGGAGAGGAGAAGGAGGDGGAGGAGSAATCDAVAPPAGFTPVVLASFQMLTTTGGTPPGAFPNGGGSFAILEQDRQQITSIAFTVPSVPACTPGVDCPLGDFEWSTINDVDYLNVNGSYVSLSKCPSDVRIPPAGVATESDPTFARGCRSWAAGPNGELTGRDILSWQLVPSGNAPPSTDTLCNLEAGETYYFTLVLDGPGDGVIDVAGTSTGCESPSAGDVCGMGLLYYTYAPFP